MIRAIVVCGFALTAGAALHAQGTLADSRLAADAREAARVHETLARPVTIQLDGVALKIAVKKIALSAGVRVQYRVEALDTVMTPVTLHATHLPLGDAMDQVLRGTSLHAVVLAPDLISIRPGGGADHVVQGIIQGRVTDAQTKQPIRGANVTLDDATKGMLSGEDGVFRFSAVNAGEHTLTVKYIGYHRQMRRITVVDDGVVTADMALESSANQLDQVVVTGTVIPTELKAVPNAMTVITAKELEQQGITEIDQLFRGDVPGLFAVNQGSGNQFGQVLMFSRGATALSNVSTGTNRNTNPIKTYVDGVELADPQYLSQIDPKSIERIEILTGPQASTIYGSNAINGVMQIFTKRGTTSAPQFTLNLLSGWVQNNFTSALTPQHDDNAQLSGVEGRLSYNAGASWNYTGAWTPGKQMAIIGGFGGIRLLLPTTLGPVTADVTLRRTVTQTKKWGVVYQGQNVYEENGWYNPFNGISLELPTKYTLVGQTLGVTLNYALADWWSHELGLGQDASDNEHRITAKGYRSVSDTGLLLEQTRSDRHSLRYTTTVHVPMTSQAHATITIGADAWQNLSMYLFAVSRTVLTGTLNGSSGVTRQPGHNTGGFLQGQVNVAEQLFLTYGLRAEWNPNFGADAQPNYAPRYGIAYTRDIGPLTAKLRASYGRSTRPPSPNQRAAQKYFGYVNNNPSYLQDFGNFDYYLANPALAPEHQQGGEGGLELYFSTRGSLIVTRYNQTVDGLIGNPLADSVRSLTPNPSSYTDGGNFRDANNYGYMYQYQYVNIGSIRNQGWELQGSVNTGPFTTRGTYSWTKSRTIGITPKYRSLFDAASYPQYQPGATFQLLPEHTWATGITYTHTLTTLTLDVSGTGLLRSLNNDMQSRYLISSIRLPQNRLNMNFGIGYVSFNSGYALADLTASHRLSTRIEGVAQIKNLFDHYTNDFASAYAAMGRQVKAGFRIRLQ